MEEESTNISTGPDNKKISHSKGVKGQSPHSPSSDGRRASDVVDLSNLDFRPFEEVAEEIEAVKDEIGVKIHPEKNIHGLTLKYLFGSVDHPTESKAVSGDGEDKKSQAQIERESELYDKLVDFLKDYYTNKRGDHWFEKRGAMWPEPYVDPEREIKAHFKIQMHKGGRFMIFLHRDMNFNEFFDEFVNIFTQALTFEEVEYLLKLLFEQGEKDDYIHVAHAIDPDEVVEKRLSGAVLHVKAFGTDDTTYYKTYVDKSQVDYEIEAEGDAAKVQDFMDLTSRQIYVASNLAQMKNNLDRLHKFNDYTLRNQDHMHEHLHTHTNQMTAVLETQSQIRERQKFNLNELEAHLTQQDDKLELIPQLQENDRVINTNLVNGLNAMASSFKHLSWQHQNQDKIIDQAVGQAKEEIVEAQRQDTDLLLDEHNRRADKLDEIHEDIKNISSQIDALGELFEREFEKARRDYRDNLLRVLDLVAKMPGQTSQEIMDALQEELDVSQSTMYRYFKTLREKGLLTSNEMKRDKSKGRPSRFYFITNKVRDYLNEIKKRLKN